jgi:UDP-N-acetylmuramyl pentapeptide phosphotransferase/UDP-N-acetylglucosamine-1-phosphate transferase
MGMGFVPSFGIGSLVARTALAWVRNDPRAAALHRTNFHGRTVTLAGGPALAAGATVGAVLGAPGAATAAAAFTAGTVAGSVGFYDDIVGHRPEQKAAKGFAGHLGALREGRVTSGLVKIAGVGAGSLAAAALLAADPSRPRRGVLRGTADVLLGAGVIAGTANLLNLLDLRPGRALKAGAAIGAPLVLGRGGAMTAGTLGAGAALLPRDLDEDIMLGDAGANALGALLGVALAARTGPAGRAFALTVLAGLTAASEKISFTKVIQDTPWLRRLDELGRLDPTPAARPGRDSSTA